MMVLKYAQELDERSHNMADTDGESSSDDVTLQATPKRSGSEQKEKKTERLSVNVSPDTARLLRDMAKAKVTSITEIIRRAIVVLSLLEKEQSAGAEIHLVRTDEQGNRVVQVLHLV
jgi:uncharacterized protein (DUF1778 family)